MFIRTKDGIIDTTKIATGNKYMDFATNDESFRAIFKIEPLAKSDNLAELCDEFVIHVISEETEFEAHYEYDDFDTFKGAKIKEGYKGSHYGAIWTDKGLIYVAKMNEDGELVLIW